MSGIGLVERVQLILARVEILKLKSTNGGYDWSHIPDNIQEKIDATLVEIDELLS